MANGAAEANIISPGVSLSLWRTVAMTMIGAVVAGAGYWVTVGREKIDRSEAIEIVQAYSPYTRDKVSIDELRTNVAKLIVTVGDLTVEVAKLRVQLGRE